MSSFWAYAITDRAPGGAQVGIAGAPIEHVAIAEGMVLIGSTLARLPEPSIDVIREHDRVVRAIADDAVAILPMRFATRGDRREIARSIEARALAVRAGLAAVRGACQVTMRIIGGPPEAADEFDPSAGPGTRFLRERARALSPRLPGWELLASEPRALARAERVERGDPRTERVRIYHLIAREDLARWSAAATRMRDAVPEWAITIGAPAPPWAFVPEEIA